MQERTHALKEKKASQKDKAEVKLPQLSHSPSLQVHHSFSHARASCWRYLESGKKREEEFGDIVGVAIDMTC
jgi:hypothetical protein